MEKCDVGNMLQGEANPLGARTHSGRCDALEREEGLTYKREG
jgi:hypothetical protein